MLRILFFLWISFAAIMGFALGGSVVAAWLTPASIHERCAGIESPNPGCQSAQEIKESTDAALAYYTKWLMIGTGVLAAATIALFIATIGLYIGGEREFRSTHRPKLRVKHLVLSNDIWHGEPIIVDLTCVNTGTSDAFLAEVGIRYEIVRIDRDLPMNPSIPSIYKFGGGRLECGRNWPQRGINTKRILTPAENADIQQGRSKLYCIGYVSYLDAAERMRITGFCRVLTFPQNAIAHIGNCRFRRFRDPDYEYED